MRKWWKQLWCVHWFGDVQRISYDYHEGHIVCNQQREFDAVDEVRVCHFCELRQERRVSTECVGWS